MDKLKCIDCPIEGFKVVKRLQIGLITLIFSLACLVFGGMWNMNTTIHENITAIAVEHAQVIDNKEGLGEFKANISNQMAIQTQEITKSNEKLTDLLIEVRSMNR